MLLKIMMIFILSMLFGLGSLSAQDSIKVNKAAHHQKFIDKNGDGYNDNAPDHDGDGIPNGLDPDWKKLVRHKGKQKAKSLGRSFVDLDGDGINDYLQGYGKNADIGDKDMLSKDKAAAMDHQGRKGKGSPRRKQAGKH